ncbi:S24 family peptidase [Pseudoalteromonas phenolica]|uniref:S24 family peptidase n=1 Tax=Pseudoalteromonas phenolica TaxID=161398 RepID=UPI0020167E08|nr:S24 family peptidase [Pseudoalteromonas phenolica]
MKDIKPNEKLQLAFISFIQRVLSEGDFVATYKYALLNAIADICIEKLDVSTNESLKIEHSLLAEKILQLYWHHATPFSNLKSGADALLKQNSGAQSKVISVLYECQQNNIRSLGQLKRSSYWNESYRAALNTLKTGPLWRLQILAKQEECFLYPHNKKPQYIELKPGIAACFRRFYDLVVYLSKNAWLQKIQSIKYNQALIGPQSKLESFLFGEDRQSLAKVKPLLVDLQKNQCFYCQKPFKNDVEIDHFIPFSRYSNDLAHNFVAAHRRCNNNKRDFLASYEHRDNWIESNLVKHNQVIESELSSYFDCSADQSIAVSNWAYEVARSNHAKLWHSIDTFVDSAPIAPVLTFKKKHGEREDKIETNKTEIIAELEPQLYYFPNLKIACGHFKTGDESDAEYMDIPDGVGKVDPNKHFFARASGNSMNGGKSPIFDGDLLLLEFITPESAGSLQNQTVAIERLDSAGDSQYLLRDIKKATDENGNSCYQLIAKNPDYETLVADESMKTFARLKKHLC